MKAAAVISVTPFLLCLPGCKRIDAPPPRKPPIFTDTFDRPVLGAAWNVSAPAYVLTGGELVVQGAHNHPAWLRHELPRDAVIELDAWSADAAGDIKVEAWGDGQGFATQAEYTSTGYVFIQGGWHNQITALCRMEEHGPDRKERRDVRVVPGQHYHWLIARHGAVVDWYIDGKLVLSMDDPAPLTGPGHRYFAFDDWETEVHFDNLVIRPY